MNTFKSVGKYNEAKSMLHAYDNAMREYCNANKTNGIPVDVAKTFPYSDIVNNELRSMIEVWEFMHEKPKDYFLYIQGNTGKAINWMGEILGTVGFGKEYRDSFGGIRQSINVYGYNGVNYHGTYYKSAGDYARIKAFKR